jgi:hypothetical protein
MLLFHPSLYFVAKNFTRLLVLKTFKVHFLPYAKAISVLQDSEKVLKKRNKLIRIADKSEGGWKFVDEYLSDDVASNS